MRAVARSGLCWAGYAGCRAAVVVRGRLRRGLPAGRGPRAGAVTVPVGLRCDGLGEGAAGDRPGAAREAAGLRRGHAVVVVGPGVGLQAAIGQAADRVAQAGHSVFAGLRRRHPGLMPQELSKATLLAITRAMEDECCARAEHAALFAGFQQERFYRQSRERWKELARTARVVVIFADFGESSGPDASPVTVRIPADAPLRREWFMVCAAPDYPAFIAGWEFPGQPGVPDARRRFEVLWSADPPAVRDAALICAQVARAFSPSLGRLPGDLPALPPASADLHRAIGLFNRMAGYLDKRADR